MTDKLSEVVDAVAKNVIKALTNVAAQVSTMSDDVKHGRLHDVLPTETLVKAFTNYVNLVQNKTVVADWLGQQEFAGRFMPTDYLLIEMFDQNKRSPNRITEALQTILNTAEMYGNPNQMMMPGLETMRPSAEQVIREGLDRFNREQGREAASERMYMLRDIDDLHLDIEKNIQHVATMNPVSALTGQEFQKSETSLLDRVTEYYAELGGSVISPVLGHVELGHVGISKTISTKLNRFKAAAFAAVPDIIRQGEIISTAFDWNQKGYDSVVIAAPIVINKENFFAAAIVRLLKDKTHIMFMMY